MRYNSYLTWEVFGQILDNKSDVWRHYVMESPLAFVYKTADGRSFRVSAYVIEGERWIGRWSCIYTKKRR